ncbi:MAG: bifunctional nicotinamidase/pyrazinamidase [Bacteriovoracales bacterium]
MKALLVVDIQNDFLLGGALAVPKGDEIIPLINSLMEKFELVFATQDFHPKGHKSFASYYGKKPGDIVPLGKTQQILWPDHCVQGTKGADFSKKLNQKKIIKIFQKGTDPNIDSYSGFFDNDHINSTGLSDYLKSKGITEIYIAGLATDYCVKYTTLDGLKLGFKMTIIKDACRGINLNPGDVEKTLEELEKKGAKITQSNLI